MSLPRLVVLALLLGSLVLAPAATADDSHPVGEWPLSPQPDVVRGFDPPAVVWGSGHRGVDLLGRPGQSVHSALPGTVTFAGQLAGRGVVVVSHGDTRTTYEPVAATVETGEKVTRGAVLGRLELVGSHCPFRACLHWGWLRGDAYLDPLGLVGGGPVRLLPLWRRDPADLTPTAALVAVPRPAAWAGPVWADPVWADPVWADPVWAGAEWAQAPWTHPYSAVLARLDRLAG